MNNRDGVYHFTPGSETASQAVVRAIAFVKDVDPFDLEPLASVVDPDALNRLFSSADEGVVTFTMAGVPVEVDAAGEIRVHAPEGSAEGQGPFADVSNILVRSSPDRDEVCHDLFARGSLSGANVLEVLSSTGVDERESLWTGPGSDRAADIRLIAVADPVRSSLSADAEVDIGPPNLSIDAVSDPTDLDRIASLIDEALEAWEGDENRIEVCFESVGDVLEDASADRATPFFDRVTDRVERAGATAHYHLDPARCDQDTLDALSALFEVTVEVTENDDLRVIE